MKNVKLYLLGLLIVPWLSIFLLGKKDLKRYSPSALFISLVILMESLVARKRVWWFYKKLSPKMMGETSLIWGLFLIGSIWILKFTYGKIFRYLILNLSIDAFYTYFVMTWFKRIGYSSLIRLTKNKLFLMFFVKSILLYTFQFFIDGKLGKEKGEDGMLEEQSPS